MPVQLLPSPHDSLFLDKMASEIWELSGNGDVHRYNGNYSDYAAQCIPAESAEKAAKPTEKKERTFVGKKKLKFSYREQREFESIDDDIAALEQQIQETEAQLGACTSDYVKLQELSEKKERFGNATGGKDGTLGLPQRPCGAHCKRRDGLIPYYNSICYYNRELIRNYQKRRSPNDQISSSSLKVPDLFQHLLAKL